jgi:hypothetical protein
VAYYDATYYDPLDYETGDTGATAPVSGGRFSSLWALQLHLDRGFPVTFPWAFSAPPLRVSTVDVYPDQTGLGDVLYERRIVDAPQVTVESLDVYGAVRAGESVRCRLTGAGAVDLHAWVAREHRGKRVDGYLLDLDPQRFVVTGEGLVFSGEILAMADDPTAVDLLIRIADVYALTEALPAVRIDPSWAPYAPAPSRGLPVPEGIGIGRRLPVRAIRARTADDTAVALPVTANAGTDALTAADGHDWITGDGPVQLTSTGTPPAGLARDTDYWIVAVTDTAVRLATTRARALTGQAIDLTSAGTGAHALVAGLAPNYDEATDLVVGRGNVGVVRLWLDGDTELPEFPLAYAVDSRGVRQQGRYCTTVRYQGDLTDVQVEADVLRVYPDADDGVVGDYKWLRGFWDDSGRGRHAVPTANATATVAASTGDLVESDEHRFGLGAFRPPAFGQGWLDLQNEPFRLDTFTLELRCTPALDNVAAANYLYLSPGTRQNAGIVVTYNGQAQRVEATVVCASGAPLVYTGATASALRGVPLWVVVRRDAATGRTEVLVNGTSQFVATNTAPVVYGSSLRPAELGAGFGGLLKYTRISNVYRTDAELATADQLWRRNGIQWATELIASAGRRADAASCATAATAWASVEGGSLRCDGWITEDTDLRSTLLALAPMRGIRFGIASGTKAITATIPTAAASTGTIYGHGEQVANMTTLPTRVRASLSEAVRELVVKVRQRRSAQGTGYDRELRRTVFAAGVAEQVLEVPFVDDALTADIVADWTAKRLAARDQLLTFGTGRDGRNAVIGQRVGVDVPGMQVNWAAEVVGLDRSAAEVTLRVVPWSAAAFTYTPQPLPPDPAEPGFEPLTLGGAPTLAAYLAAGRVTLRIVGNVVTLRPIGTGQIAEWAAVTGAAAPWAAVDEATPDGDTSYVQFDDLGPRYTAAPRWFAGTFGLAPLTQPGTISHVVARANATHLLNTKQAHLTLAVSAQEGAQSALDPAFVSTEYVLPYYDAPAYATYAWTLPLARGDRPWTTAEITARQWGVRTLTLAGGIRVSAYWLDVYYAATQQLDGGSVLYYRSGPSPTAPATPPAWDQPRLTAADLGVQVDDLGGAPGDTYWYWARVFDRLGRQVALLGPVSVVG